MTTSTTSSRVECGYCGSDVAVNVSSDELRSHKRHVDGETVTCRGSGQRAWLYPGNLLPGDEVQPQGSKQRIVVVGRPTVATLDAVWSVQGYDPAGSQSQIRKHLMPGNTLLRLWTRQGGENR